MSTDPTKRPKRASSAAAPSHRLDAAEKSTPAKAPVVDAGPADAVERLAHALLREYMHRRGFKRTLQAFDAESPRDERTISSRQVMGGMLAWASATDRMQAEAQFFTAAGGSDATTVLAAAPPGTFMEQLCSFRLRRRHYVQNPEMRRRVVEGGVLEALAARAATASGGFVEGDAADTDTAVLAAEAERLRAATASADAARSELADTRARTVALRERLGVAEAALREAEAEAAAIATAVAIPDEDGAAGGKKKSKDKKAKKEDSERKEKKSKKDKTDKKEKEKGDKEKKSKTGDKKKDKKSTTSTHKLSSSTGGLAFDPLGLTSEPRSSAATAAPVANAAPGVSSTAALGGRGSRWAPDVPLSGSDGPAFAPMPTSVRAAFGASSGGSPNARASDGGLGLGYSGGARPSSAPAAIRKPVISSSPPSVASVSSSRVPGAERTGSLGGARPASAGAAPRDASSVKSAIAGGSDAKPARVRLVQFVDA